MSEPETPELPRQNPLLIHVRFAPNGEVTEIGERPQAATAQS